LETSLAMSSLANLAGSLFQFVLRGKVIAFVTVVICAYFSAKIVSSLVEAEVLLPTANAAPAPAPRPAPTPKVAKPAIDSAVIADRNIFCSSCEPERTTTGYRGEPVTLIATSIADSGRRATLRVLSSNVQGSWGLDDSVPGVGKIVRIGGTSIDVVDDGNHQQTISLLDAGSGSVAATSDPGPARPADPFEGRIKKLSDTSFEVERDVVRELVGAGGTNAGARAMPVMDKGQVTGIKLMGVRPSSVAAKIGLKSMDVISAIDGEPIKTAQSVLDLYAKLDKLNGVEVQGTRAGKPLAISLKFR
jgi:hypothetical protein